MASKFMKIKRIVLPLISVIILTSQLTGCAIMSKQEVEDVLATGAEIEIEIAEQEQLPEINIGDNTYIVDTEDIDSIEDADADAGIIEDADILLEETEDIADEIQEVEATQPEVEDDTTQPEEAKPEAVDLFTDTNETVYATQTVNLRSGPSTSYEKVGSLSKADKVTRIGVGTGEAEGWSEITLADGKVVYVSSEYLSTTKPVVQTQTPSTGGNTNSQQSSSGGQQSSGSQQSSGGNDLGFSPGPGMRDPSNYDGPNWMEIGEGGNNGMTKEEREETWQNIN